MVIWIGIYSLFNSPDFNYEVVVLYGEVTFWATVFLTLVIAIGEAVSFFLFLQTCISLNLIADITIKK